MLGAVRRRILPHDDEARLWVEYQGGYLKTAFKNVHPTWNQEEALRETLLSPANKWMGKGRLASELTSKETAGETTAAEEDAMRTAAFPHHSSSADLSLIHI